MTLALIEDGQDGDVVRAKLNVLVEHQNRLFAFDASSTAESLAHLDTWVVGDTYRVPFFDSEAEVGSSGAWVALGDDNPLGPVGFVSYRTIFGGAMPGSPALLDELSGDLGFVNGETIVINGTTITLVTSGATGNQVNLTDRLKTLLARMTTVMTANATLGDQSRVEIESNLLAFHSSDVNNRVSATGLVLSGTGLAKVGLTAGTYPFANGITMEGTSCLWEFQPDRGGVVDVRALGNRCDGTTPADRSRLFHTLCGARSLALYLVNDQAMRSDIGNLLRIDRTFDFRRVSCDIGIQAGTPVTATTAAAFGDFFDEEAHVDYLADYATWQGAGSDPDDEPTNPNTGVDVWSFVDWAGDTRYRGMSIYAAGDASNALHCRQRFRMRGDGNFDFTTEPTVIGPFWTNDNSCFGEYHVDGSYLAAGNVLHENLEKSRISGSFIYCDWIAFLDPTGSVTPDTIEADYHAQDCRHGIWEEEGSETSVCWKLFFEHRLNTGDGSPFNWFRNGKMSRFIYQMRAIEGDLCNLVDKTTNVGIDTMIMEGVAIHGYGLFLDWRRGRHGMGKNYIKDWDDGPDAGGATPCPVIWMKRMGDGGGLEFHGVAIKNSMGFAQFGDTDTDVHANGLYSIDCNYGTYSAQMGLIFPFNSDGSENTSSYPTTGLLAFQFNKMKGGSVHITHCDGDIDIGAAVTNNARIIVPRSMVETGSEIAVHASAVCDVGYVTLDDAGLNLV